MSELPRNGLLGWFIQPNEVLGLNDTHVETRKTSLVSGAAGLLASGETTATLGGGGVCLLAAAAGLQVRRRRSWKSVGRRW
ncbi:hypothetical protein ACLOJK_040878 [Asimina triloba]